MEADRATRIIAHAAQASVEASMVVRACLLGLELKLVRECRSGALVLVLALAEVM